MTRYALLEPNYYGDPESPILAIPDGLPIDVLRAWLGKVASVRAVFRDPEFVPQVDKPTFDLFAPEHRETAMAMLGPRTTEPPRGDR